MIENRLFSTVSAIRSWCASTAGRSSWVPGVKASSRWTLRHHAALDRNALFQLGFKSASEVVGAPLERVFNISLPALVGRSQKKSFHALPIYRDAPRRAVLRIAQAPQSKRQQVSKQRGGSC